MTKPPDTEKIVKSWLGGPRGGPSADDPQSEITHEEALQQIAELKKENSHLKAIIKSLQRILQKI